MIRFAVAFALAGCLTASAGAARAPIVSTRLDIQAVAQDGNRVAWMSGQCFTVRIRSLATRTATVGNGYQSICESVLPPLLALAGTRALWVVTSAGNNVYAEVITGTPRGRNRPVEEVIGSSSGSDGDYLTDVAGDGPTLVYSVISMSFLDTCIDPGTPCDYFVDGGRVMRMVGRSARRIPNLPPALAVAVSGRRIALVVAAHDAPTGAAVPSGELQVRDALSGAAVSDLTVDGVPAEVALGTSVLAATVKTGARSWAVESFRAATGEPLARISVVGHPLGLAVSGRRVVYGVGRTLRLVDAVTGIAHTVAVAHAPPFDVSIEGRRVVWGESWRGRSRIEQATAG